LSFLRATKIGFLIGTGLAGLAYAIIFIGKPGGFESSIGYFFMLLPGYFLVILIADPLHFNDAMLHIVAAPLNVLWYASLATLLLTLWNGIAGVRRRFDEAGTAE
jgi:hypothetical protein